MLGSLEFAEAYDLALIVMGVGAMGIAALLRPLSGRVPSLPILLLGFGYLVWSLPLDIPSPDPRIHGSAALHLTEIAVIVSLMGVGLKIDRFPHLRSWSSTWRLLGITMPLTIAAAGLLGWWVLGLTPAAAILFGAVMAPTDPVLASDVQVGEPLEAIDEEAAVEAEEELRFALTSEAGLNDSLAFPFTYLALLVHQQGTDPFRWWTEWLLGDVVYRIAVAIAVGAAVGAVLARLLLALPRESERDRAMTGIGALAGTLLLYGATEALSGYGFLAVFVGALVIRHRETTHETHRSLHVFAEQSEQLLMAVILIALGGAVAEGLLGELTLPAVLVGLVLVLLVRPLAGAIGLAGSSRLSPVDRGVASFFGIRGIGSLFYLSYALQQQRFFDSDLLWSTTAFVVVFSVVLHGMSAPPVIRWRDRRRERGVAVGAG